MFWVTENRHNNSHLIVKFKLRHSLCVYGFDLKELIGVLFTKMYLVRFYYLKTSSKPNGILSNTHVITKSNSYFWALNRAMRKISNVLLCGLVLLMACNKETPPIPPLPPNQDAPSLDFEFVSVASTVKFIPFGDTLANRAINKGYELQLSDTNESIVMACPGIISSIVPDTTPAGGSLIT